MGIYEEKELQTMEETPVQLEAEKMNPDQWVEGHVTGVSFDHGVTQEDILKIAGLKNLKHLDIAISDTEQGIDLSCLANCKNLREVHIVGGHIRNAGGLSDLTHLQHIGLCETQWNEEPLSLLQELCQDSDMTELESLELRHIQVTDISPLVNLQKIQSVRLVDTGIDDIEPLRELKYLTNLEIFGNKSERVKEQAELYFRDIEYLEISEDVPYGL